MPAISTKKAARRYEAVEHNKSNGVTYTPSGLSAFVAEKIIKYAQIEGKSKIRLLDPAVGDGILVTSLLAELASYPDLSIEVFGFDTNPQAIAESTRRISVSFPKVSLNIFERDFLDFVLEQKSDSSNLKLFSSNDEIRFDLVIANPPYVRTQIMGAEQAQKLSSAFGLAGRIDLYQAFLLGIAQVLHCDGTAGIIVSNRFMTTKGGGTLRSSLLHDYRLKEVWDLGDTKLFSAAVLPAVIISNGKNHQTSGPIKFCSVYESDDLIAEIRATDPIAALTHNGCVEVEDGRKFLVKHGTLDCSGGEEEVWRISTGAGDRWMSTVTHHTWATFGDIGRIRVGVKTCADKVFIRHDWESKFSSDKPELLRPLTTHHCASRFRAIHPKHRRQILYPHENYQGQRRAVDLEQHPNSKMYLESFRGVLEARTYVITSGRNWYEIWVPQDPQLWELPKLVFRDISERPTFWIDLDGSVVNGDCYWLVAKDRKDTELIWLAAAVANSTFAEVFYDHRFNNKLYAGRRRFITQYVEQFPIPDPSLPTSKEIMKRAKRIYDSDHSGQAAAMEQELDMLIWHAFGLTAEEATG